MTDADIGSAPRVPFYPDQDLPRGFRMVTPADYTGSGFDRGHMCDHSDRSSTPEASHATFSMSNMIPLSPDVNEKAWAQLEAYCRKLVERSHKHLYIVAGPSGQGGEGKKGPRLQIGRATRVVVLAQCWKFIMVLDGGQGDDLRKVDSNIEPHDRPLSWMSRLGRDDDAFMDWIRGRQLSRRRDSCSPAWFDIQKRVAAHQGPFRKWNRRWLSSDSSGEGEPAAEICGELLYRLLGDDPIEDP